MSLLDGQNGLPQAADTAAPASPASNLAPHHPRERIYARPPQCEGDFRSFLSSFKLYLHLQRIHELEDQKAALLLAVSTPRNRLKVQGFANLIQNHSISYDLFEKELTLLFSPESESLMARAEFLNLKQGATEDFCSFFALKTSLYHTAFPENTMTMEQTRFYTEEVVKSLFNLEVKRILVRRLGSLTKENLREAITTAIQGESTLRSFGLAETPTNDGLIYSDSHQSHLSRRMTEEPMDISSMNGNCHKCGLAGHWAKDCRKEEPKKFQSSGNRSARPMGPSKFTGGVGSGKKETRSCNRCWTPGHLRRSCLIPEDKIEGVRRRNKEKKKPGAKVNVVSTEVVENQDGELLAEFGRQLGIGAMGFQ